jgi:hypothetical protein
MGEIIVDFVRIIESGLKSFINYILIILFMRLILLLIVILRITFLNENLSSKLFQKLICLPEQLFYFVIFLELY